MLTQHWGGEGACIRIEARAGLTIQAKGLSSLISFFVALSQCSTKLDKIQPKSSEHLSNPSNHQMDTSPTRDQHAREQYCCNNHCPWTAVELPHFDGLAPLEPYLLHIKLATLHNGWDQNEAAVPLSLALESKVLQVLVGLPLSEVQDTEQLMAALWQRFGQTEPEESYREVTGEATPSAIHQPADVIRTTETRGPSGGLRKHLCWTRAKQWTSSQWWFWCIC